MNDAAMPVHAWLQARTSSFDRESGLLLISVATSDTAIRDEARSLIRDAVREVMAQHCDIPIDAVNVSASPGQPPKLKSGALTAALSISHEPRLSLAAISLHAPVGIDIMRVDDGFDWHAVAKDYFEPDAVSGILRRPASEHAYAFACEWTRLEARLKCLGKGLEEQNPVRDAALRACHTRRIAMPDGMVGHVALQARGTVV